MAWLLCRRNARTYVCSYYVVATDPRTLYDFPVSSWLALLPLEEQLPSGGHCFLCQEQLRGILQKCPARTFGLGVREREPESHVVASGFLVLMVSLAAECYSFQSRLEEANRHRRPNRNRLLVRGRVTPRAHPDVVVVVRPNSRIHSFFLKSRVHAEH